MAKITFVYPDFESLGVEYLMAVCLKDGHNVDFVFYQAEDSYISIKKKTVSFSNIAKRITDTNPNFVAFSCVTNNYRLQLSCARAIKEIMPDVVTIFGGVHITAVPEIVLKEKEVDCVAIGEAENSFISFLKECKISGRCMLPNRTIKGIVYKKENKFFGDFKEDRLPELNTLPFPYKKPFYSHLKSFSREYYIITSRGCPHSCSYCFNSCLYCLRGGAIFRQRAVNNVINEILHAKREYNSKYIFFQDDCFTFNDDWIMEFCQIYKKEINLPFACITMPQYLNKDKIKALRASGCCHIEIGVQTLNNELCKEILHRCSNNTRTAEVISMLKDTGMLIQIDHMLGIPGDTLDIEEESAIFYNRFRPHVISVFWLTYYPGTAVIGIAKEKGLLSTQDINNINDGIALTKESEHTGGSMKNPHDYYGICLLLSYMPLLPRCLVEFIIVRKLYKKFLFNNIFISIGLSRFILAILYRNNFVDRGYIIRAIDKLFSHE